MKVNTRFLVLCCLSFWGIYAQDIVPVAKTKAQKKAEKKASTKDDGNEVNLGSIKFGQSKEISSAEDAKEFLNSSLAELKKLKKVKKTSKKRQKGFNGKNYEGLAVSKKIVKRGSNARLVYQEFYVVKGNAKPSIYNRSLTFYNSKTKKIVEATSRGKAGMELLHGPFKEYHGETLFAEGSYFLGAKHGRWLDFDKDFNLVNKEYYEKGFLANANIVFYNNDSTKVKEVIPNSYNQITGPYYAFHEDGTLKEEGKYENGKKLGKWIEYYLGGNRRKKETQFPNLFSDNSDPVVLREFDTNGKIIFENQKTK